MELQGWGRFFNDLESRTHEVETRYLTGLRTWNIWIRNVQ